MVEIKIMDDRVILTVLGIHKFFALKGKIVFDKKNITKVSEGCSSNPPLLKIPGTRIPGIITAGTYYGRKRKEFWDTVYKNKTIEIELINENFTKIVVDVENPGETIRLLTK